MEKVFASICMKCGEVFDTRTDIKCPKGCQEIVYGLDFYIDHLEKQVGSLHKETLNIYRNETSETREILQLLKESFKDVIHYNGILQEQNRRLRGALNNLRKLERTKTE